MTDNVFYRGTGYHVKISGVHNYNFINNLMISVSKTSKDVVACYGSYEKVDKSVKIYDNLCQGSAEHGFAITFLKCGDTNNQYKNNTVGSA